MATGPQPGDLIIRNTITLHFEVLTIDGGRIAGPYESFAAARIRAQLTADGATVGNRRLISGPRARCARTVTARACSPGNRPLRGLSASPPTNSIAL